MNLGTAQIIQGNALNLPLPDSSVDLVVTSPPYFGLRSYQDAGEHYDGQIGSEATPTEFLDALLAATREMVRVLKPSGSIFVNLGDKYSSTSSTSNWHTMPLDHDSKKQQLAKLHVSQANNPRLQPGVPTKSLMGIPWRYAINCIDQLGLILRAEIIWAKPNGLPESVTDRVRRSHEQWFWFQQSGGIEAETESFPFCPQCGRPVDAKTTLIQRLKESNGGVIPDDLTHHVRTDQPMQDQRASRADQQVAAVPGSAGVPLLVHGDTAGDQDGPNLLEDPVVAVVDHDAQVRVASGRMAEPDSSLTVDDASQPAEFCTCTGHPLILNDEPWIPQGLAAEVMQGVADGEIDPQQAADFLSGDYVRTHSVWFHFTKQPRYYSSVDEIREPQKNPPRHNGGRNNGSYQRADDGVAAVNYKEHVWNPLGKLPGSVWTIPTQPLTVPPELGVDHFAAYPMEWPRRIIQGWSPQGICVDCSEGRRPTRGYDRELEYQTIIDQRINEQATIRWCNEMADYCDNHNIRRKDLDTAAGTSDMGAWWASRLPHRCAVPTDDQYAKLRQWWPSLPDYPEDLWEDFERKVAWSYGHEDDAVQGRHHSNPSVQKANIAITGYMCGCHTPTAPTTPSVVLDPFGGTGTTALMAKALGRTGITIDLSSDYCRLAQWRCNDPRELAAALQVEKPEPVHPDQLDLFSGIE